jgi:alpha-L-fucosidase 2
MGMTNVHLTHGEKDQALESRRIVSLYTTVFNKPPENIPSSSSVDGPLLGNGDMEVAIGGFPEAQYLILCKNDLWRLQHACGKSSPVPFGQLTIDIPSLKNASYKVTQDLYTATTRGVFGRNGAAVHMNSYVAATEGLLILELTSVGQPFDVTVALQVAKGRGSDSESGREGEVFWGRRAFTKDVDIPGGAAVAWKALGLEKQPEDGLFVLKPDEPVTLVLAMKSVFKSSSYAEEAVKAVSDLADKACLSAVRQAHEQWWTAYWAKSYVNISDPIIEKQYYLSLWLRELFTRY